MKLIPTENLALSFSPKIKYDKIVVNKQYVENIEVINP